MSETVIYAELCRGLRAELRPKGVLLVTLDAPERLNALDQAMKRDLIELVTRVQMDDAVRVVVFAGEGRAFCAGDHMAGYHKAEPASVPAIGGGHATPIGTANALRVFSQGLNLAVRNLDKLTVAAIGGPAIQTGLSLALCCDFRIGSTAARLGSATLRFALLPDEGGHALLVQHLGLGQALDFVLRKRIVDAAEALRLGLLNEVVEPDVLLDRALELAGELADGPQVAMRMLKRSLYNAAESTFAAALDDIAIRTAVTDHHADARDGGRSFREKRAPTFNAWLEPGTPVADADDDPPIAYIARTHAWYGALGYAPYDYARFDEVPFAPLGRRLADARVALVTTAAPYRPELGDQGPGAPYNAAAKFFEVYSGDTALDHDLRVSHVAVDQAHLSDDANCWFPLPALRRAVAAGRIGALTARFHGAPTNRSQRHTQAVDAPEVLRRCREDGADAAILVANCPVCHQTLSLTARTLEAAGIATVLMGAARDIVETCGVPRFLFSDFPLGNAAGRPGDVASQDQTLALALGLLESAVGPRTTAVNPLRWPGPPGWKADYMNLAALSPEEIARRRAQNERDRAVAKELRDAT